MKSSATIKRLPRRWSSRSRGSETCKLHGVPGVQVACRLRYWTCAAIKSPAYFEPVTKAQTSTHSDDPLCSTVLSPAPKPYRSSRKSSMIRYAQPTAHRTAAPVPHPRATPAAAAPKTTRPRLTTQLSDFRHKSTVTTRSAPVRQVGPFSIPPHTVWPARGLRPPPSTDDFQVRIHRLFKPWQPTPREA